MCTHAQQSSSQSVYLPNKATIARVEQMTALDKYFEIALDSGEELGHSPGQFVMVSIPGIGEAPISVSSSPDTKGHFELVVRKIGRLTNALHSLEKGATVGIRGPFGTSFPVEDELRGKDVIFICGGLGLIPVRSGINYVLNRRENYQDVTILYGTRTPADRHFVKEIEGWKEREDVNYMETVDRAEGSWDGRVGVITTLLPDVALSAVSTRAVICGPPIMYKFVIAALTGRGLPVENIYVSLERRMKCGVGKCGHCQINGLYTCMDGPVFNYSKLTDVPEAI